MSLFSLPHRFLQSACLSCSAVLLITLSGCSDSNNSNSGSKADDKVLVGCADTNSCVSNPDLQIGEDRPAQVHIPSDYTPSTRYPLIIVLHGYGASGSVQAGYLGLTERVDSKQYVLVVPTAPRAWMEPGSGTPRRPAAHEWRHLGARWMRRSTHK